MPGLSAVGILGLQAVEEINADSEITRWLEKL